MYRHLHEGARGTQDSASLRPRPGQGVEGGGSGDKAGTGAAFCLEALAHSQTRSWQLKTRAEPLAASQDKGTQYAVEGTREGVQVDTPGFHSGAPKSPLGTLTILVGLGLSCL